MYEEDEFYYLNPINIEDKYLPYYEEAFKVVINGGKVTSQITEKIYNLPKFSTFLYIKDLIDKGKVNHIYEYVNMFFMFKEQYEIIEHRYLRRDRYGNIMENPVQLADRVATFVALSEPQDRVTSFDKMSKWYPVFLKKMLNMELVPNTPAMVSAGIPGFGSFACCVVDNDDNLEDISKWYKDTTFLNRSGFGIGHSLHKIRPGGSPYGKSKIKTKSSINWLFPIDDLSQLMSQGTSGREGANMVSIPVWHPDVIGFISFKTTVPLANGKKENARKLMKQIMNSDLNVKEKEKMVDMIDKAIPLKSFNMSILVNDKFMKAVEGDKEWTLNFGLPDHEHKIEITRNARDIFNLICKNAHESGDPGLLFYDRINRDNVIKKVKNSIYTTNPCGEIPLHPFSVCNLWTINLLKHFDFYHRKLTVGKMRDTINVAVRAGDNLTTVNHYPKEVPEIEKAAKEERRIGIDFTGLADYLYLSRINYGSKDAENEINLLYKMLRDTSRTYSARLGKKKGSFPLHRKSDYYISVDSFAAFKSQKCPKCGKKIEKFDDFMQCSSCNWAKFLHIRNMHLLTQAPTGTRSRMLGVSFGIEPHFYKWYESTILEGKNVPGINRILEWYLKLGGDFEAVVENINKGFSCPVLDNWVEAHDLKPEQHLKVQAIIQRWVDQAVSKCLVKGTLINTNKGIIAIENMGEAVGNNRFGRAIDNLYIINNNGDKTKVLKHYSGGIRQTKRIRFNNGIEIEASLTHKLMGLNGWINVSDIKIGDIIKIRKSDGFNRSGKKNISFNYEIKTNAKNINFPKFMSEELSLLCGMLCADGSTCESSGALSLTTADDSVEKLYIYLLKSIFDITPKIFIDKRGNNLKNITFSSRNLTRYINMLIGNSCENKHAPEQVLCGSKKEQIMFMNGVTLDGYFARNRLIIYEGYSIDLVNNIANMLDNNNSFYYIGSKKVKGGVKSKKTYSIKINNNLLQPIEEHKDKDYYDGHRLIVPEIKKMSYTKNSRKWWDIRNYNRGMKNGYITKGVADRLNIKYEEDISICKVTNISYSKNEVFDIEVNKGHTYLVNSIINHNTINLSREVGVGDIADMYMLAWKSGLKGITMYREGSHFREVIGKKEECPECQSENILKIEGCSECRDCGWSKCSV